MNLRRKRPTDSLYMLLDTMCNAFGGIILLAVLVTLLTSNERQSRAGTASDNREMLQRRLAIAETNLQASLQLLSSLQSTASDERWKKQIASLTTRKELQDALQHARDLVALSNKDLDSANAADPSERLKFLNAQLASAQARKLELQNSLNAAEDNSKRLEQRLAALNRQVTAKYNDSIRSLRLPKEYQTGKRPMYVIVQYGVVYPCRNADLSRNDNSINWASGLGDETASPIRGKGIDVANNPRELETYFNNLPKDSRYIAFCVYEDSFPTFLKAKQLAVDAGLAYGWEPFQNEDGPISFGQNGHTPNPQ
jgi:hypothetical protein